MTGLGEILRAHPRRGANIRAAASQETIGSSLWRLEVRDRLEAELEAAIADLATRSGGVNPFFEPEFLAAAADRFPGAPKRLMVLWEQLGETTTIKLAFPLYEDRIGLPAVPVLRAFSHPFAPLSLPLVDLADAAESIDRFAALLAKLDLRLPLVFEDFPRDEPTARMFTEALRLHGFELAQTSGIVRAGLTPQPSASALSPSKKARREFARQLRKLRETGEVQFETATRFMDVLLRFEEFLLLEMRGWKGRKGTSIHTIRKTAAFARQAVGAFAEQDRAAIHTLRFDNRPIASLIVLRSGHRYYPWKTAFDEAFRSFSPGGQLMLHASAGLVSDPQFEFADSLARPGSWMERLWPDTVHLTTLAIARNKPQAERVIAAAQRLANAKKLARRLLSGRVISALRPPRAPSGEKRDE